jgi:anti-sigma factor ChrR (cupin superfamily)
MSKHDADTVAGEYVLGMLSAEQRHRFEQRFEKEPALRRQVARWEILLTRLEVGNQAAPPADLWSRVERALDQEASAAPFHTVRLGDGGWMWIRPGLEKKLLYRDPATGTESYLFRMRPGALIEGHHHARAEECLVLEGDLTIGDLRLTQVTMWRPGRSIQLRTEAVMFVRGAVL